MYNLLISLAVALVVGVLVTLLGFHWYAGILPGVLAGLAAYVALARRTAQKVQVLGEQAQNVLQGATPRSEKERDAMLDKATSILEQGFQYEKWQFFLAPEIHANIGMLKYLKKDFPAAQPHLEKAFARNWMAKAMLGCIHFMAKDEAKMKAAFEECVTNGGKKESLAWAAYAWCLAKLQSKPDEALAVLGRGITENPSDEKLKKVRDQLANGKKLKMNAFEPAWWQFHLEKPPAEISGQPKVRFQYRGRRR